MVKLLGVAIFAGLLCAVSVSADEQAIQVKSMQESAQFKKFMRVFGARMQTFQAVNVPKAESVFYPFGGPDLLHPLLLFPDASTYVLVGLERIGPALSTHNADMAFKQIDSLLKRGFFVTARMCKDFNEKSGVRAALGVEILLMGGVIKSDELLDDHTTCITFKLNGKERKVYYLRCNVVKNVQFLLDFLDAHQIHDACMMKATSYCPHREMFFELKNYITEHFNTILQDDSGIPYKDLGNFDLKIYGRYLKPYGVEWRGYEQPKLKQLFDENPETPHLKFCYGYGCGKVEASMIIAQRKQ